MLRHSIGPVRLNDLGDPKDVVAGPDKPCRRPCPVRRRSYATNKANAGADSTSIAISHAE